MLGNENDIARYLSGNLSEQEEKAFLDAVSSNENLAKELEAYKAVWELTNQLDFADAATDDAWQNLQQEVKAPRKILGFDWLKVAASITLLAAFSVGIVWFVFTSKELTYTSANQGIELKDQSLVTLNKGSELKVHKEFNKRTREVYLHGEAYFDIEKSKKPFIVHTENGEIQVLGTEFSVYSQDEGFIQVELYEGKVLYTNTQEEIILKPGQRLVINDASIIESIEPATGIRWNKEEIVCKNSTLSYILGQLSMHYGVDYKIGQRFLKQHYTVVLPTQDLDACLQTLSQISDKNFVLKNNTILIK
jgi:transmembrane sensor